MSKKQPVREFFDEIETLVNISKLKDPLGKLSAHIDFEYFRPTFENIFEMPMILNHQPP